MFGLAKEVPSLELCKRLKELGYPQENGEWYWVKRKVVGKEDWRVGRRIEVRDAWGKVHFDYRSDIYIPDIEVEEVVRIPLGVQEQGRKEREVVLAGEAK